MAYEELIVRLREAGNAMALGQQPTPALLLDAADALQAMEQSMMLHQKSRELQLAAQKEGIAAARAKGVRFGRPRKEVPEGFEKVKEMWKNREISSRNAAKQLGICQDTFLRWAKEE